MMLIRHAAGVSDVMSPLLIMFCQSRFRRQPQARFDMLFVVLRAKLSSAATQIASALPAL